MEAPTLRLDGTILNAPRLEDAEAYSAAEDDRVRQSLMLADPTTTQQARDRMQAALEHWAAGRRDWRFAIRDATDGAFAGMLAVRAAGNGGHTLEYWLAPSYRGRGHASRAAQLATRFAFCHLKLRSLRAEIVQPNPESEAVLAASGFLKTGHTVPIRDPRTGQYVQALLYFLPRRRWLQRQHGALADGREG